MSAKSNHNKNPKKGEVTLSDEQANLLEIQLLSQQAAEYARGAHTIYSTKAGQEIHSHDLQHLSVLSSMSFALSNAALALMEATKFDGQVEIEIDGGKEESEQ